MEFVLKILLILLHIMWQKVIAAGAQFHDTGFHTREKYASPPGREMFHMDFAESGHLLCISWWCNNYSRSFKINGFYKHGWAYPVHSPGWPAAARQSQGDPPAASSPAQGWRVPPQLGPWAGDPVSGCTALPEAPWSVFYDTCQPQFSSKTNVGVDNSGVFRDAVI